MQLQTTGSVKAPGIGNRELGDLIPLLTLSDRSST
jgi:hypothetical protein